MELNTPHPFAALGPAPYRFLCLETTEDRERENAARKAAGHTYTTNLCGGTCDLCGTAISNVYTFEAANGARFRVGCDCAEKVGLGELARDGKRAHAHEKRARLAAAEREAQLEAERVENEGRGLGRLTHAEVAAEIARQKKAAEDARRAASRHFGSEKERIKSMVLRYEGHYTCESGPWGSKTIYFLRTLSGDAVTWATTSGIVYRRPDGSEIERGACFRAAATVKRHTTYRGECQTEVTRLRVLN